MYLHYDKITEFKKEFYKDLLTIEHLEEGQIQLNKLTYPDGEQAEANFWGYVLKKDGKQYLLDAMDEEGYDRNPQDVLPILPQQLDKVANNKEVYYHIVSYAPARFKSEKTMSFKELVDRLCEPEHTNKNHQRLLGMAVMSQLLDRANYRFATPASFGKNSFVMIAHHLFGGIDTINKPSRAKLEYMTLNKALYIDEVNNIPKSDWEQIESFLLDVGDHKPVVTKQTRAFGKVGEQLDISNFSVGMFYNDIDHYPDGTKYFDFVPNQALLDRLPALRLYGGFTQDFNADKKRGYKKFVKENMQYYKDLIYAFTYYKEHLDEELTGYSDELLTKDIPKRWTTNLAILCKMIDLYSDSQDEFHAWMLQINSALADYKEMLEYPVFYDAASKKLGPVLTKELTEKLKKADTFKERNDLLKEVYKTGRLEKGVTDKNIW